MFEWFPPLLACCNELRLYGWDAWGRQGEPHWTIVRSIKRVLEGAGPNTIIDIAGEAVPLGRLLREMADTLRTSLLEHSSLDLKPGEKLEAMIGVPANSNSNQRFLTAEAFRAAGFDVLGMLNEPSAASVEFGHRERTQSKGQPAGATGVRPRRRHLRRLPGRNGGRHPHRGGQRGPPDSGRRRLRRDTGRPRARNRGPRRGARIARPMPSPSACWRNAASARSRSIPTLAALSWTWTACAKAGARFRSP